MRNLSLAYNHPDNITSSSFNDTPAGNSTFKLIGPTWTALTILYVASIVLALLTNATVLLAFVCCKRLRTTFNIYLINLLLANFLDIVINHIADVFNRLYNGWWLGKLLSIGPALCFYHRT